jgi:hypothetical protein
MAPKQRSCCRQTDNKHQGLVDVDAADLRRVQAKEFQ